MTEDSNSKTWTAKVRQPKQAKKFEPFSASPTPTPTPISTLTSTPAPTSRVPLSPPLPKTPPKPESPHAPPERPARATRPARSLPVRLLRGAVLGLLSVAGLLVVAVAYITSPLGEKVLTSLTLHAANAALAPMGLSMSLGSLSGFWDGEVRIFGLKLRDKKGEWLDMAEAAFYPSWSSVTRTVADTARATYKMKLADDPTGPGSVTVEVRRATLFDLTLRRLPELIPDDQPASASVEPGPLRLLPQWLEVDVAELELVRLALLEGENALFVNMHGNAHLADAQLALRAGVFVSPQARWLKGAPVPDVLAGDVTRTLRELQAAAEREGLQMVAEGQGGGGASVTASTTPSQTVGATDTSGSVGTGAASSATQAAPPPASVASGPKTSTVPPLSSSTGGGGQSNGDKRFSADNYTRGVLNVVWDGDFADVRWQIRDTLLLQRFAPGVERLWSRARVQLELSQWPPDKEHPLQARMASRFGLTTVDLPQRVRASLFSGQMFWDGRTLVARDVDLQVPMRDPQLLLRGSMGLSPASGPGVGMQLKLVDLDPLSHALGLKGLEGKVSGAVDMAMAIGRGGRHSLWWTRPLPEPPSFVANPLPGFVAGPIPTALQKVDEQYATVSMTTGATVDGAADINTAPANMINGIEQSPLWKDKRASRAPTALQAVLRLRSDALTLPGGKVDKVDLLLRGVSMDADLAPEGTATRTKKGANGAASGTASATAGAATGQAVGSTVGVTAGAAAANAAKDSDSADFSLKGLPKGMVGELQFSAASLFAMGDARVQSLWMLGGMHGDADILQLELTELMGNIPGLTMGGGLGFSYALPVRRLWPWVDGNLEIKVDSWRALAKLIKSPVQGSNMGVKLVMESRMNENNVPRQYLKAEVQAQEVDAETFTVRGVRGKVESDHVHALADVLALSLVPMSRRQAMPAEDVPKDMSLLSADLQIGPGSGGPVQWEFGQCQVKVAGEDARFDANLRGTVQGVLEGIFNFRHRLLQIKKLEMSDASGRGGRLLTPLRLALGEKPVLSPVDVALLPEGRVRLSASMRDGGGGGESRDAPKAQSETIPTSEASEAREARQARQGGGALVRGPFLLAEVKAWDFPGQNAPQADSPSVLRASARLPMLVGEGGWPLPDMSRPLLAEARWQGQVLPLWKLLPLPGRTLSGEASMTARVEGRVNAPRVSGTVSLRDANFVDSLEGLALRNIQMNVTHDAGQGSLLGASQLSLSAGDGRGGTVRLQGSLEQRGADLVVAAKGALDKLQPLHRDDLRLSVSGDLSLDGPLLGRAGQEGALLQGQLRLDKGSFTMLRGFTPSVRGLEKVAEGRGVPGPPVVAQAAKPAQKKGKKTVGVTGGKAVGKTVVKTPSVTVADATQLPVLLLPHLNVHVSAPGQFFITGKGLESEWKADLTVSGPVSAPRLLGQLAPVRGTFTLLGRQFRFERGQIHFAGAWPPDPSLDLALAYQNPQLTALVLVQGQARAPRLTLTSEPALPRDEVMAQVLFGKDMRNLSRFEAIQAANSARQLADLGPSALDVMGSVRQALGLEVLRLGSSTATASASAATRKATPGKSAGNDMSEDNTTLQAGKYLTDQIYVGVEQGLKPETSAVRVEVELTPRISVTGRTSTESSGVGLNWKLDY